MPQAFQLIIDLKQIVDRLNNLENLKEKSEPLMRNISNELYNASNRAFDNETDPETGKKWKAWSSSYYESLVKAVSKKSKGKNNKVPESTNLHKILRKSGELYRQRNRIQGPGLAGLAVKLVYARIHQYGGTVPNKKGGSHTIPARPYLGLDNYAKGKISYLTEKWVSELLDGKKD